MPKESNRRYPPYLWLYNHARRHLAEERGLSFEISFEEFLGFVAIKECHYCGSPLRWDERCRIKGKGHAFVNLDRKNSSLDYRKDNLVVCCPFCNRIKCHLLTYEEMLILAPVLKQILAARGTFQL